MADLFNATTYHMTAGGAPLIFAIGEGACTVTITSIQGYVGYAQYGAGTWTPTTVASMTGDSGYLGGVLASGHSITFKIRAAQTPNGALYVASREATNPSIASVTVNPE